MIEIVITDDVADSDSAANLLKVCFAAPTGEMPQLISPTVQHTIEIEKIKYIIGLIGSPRYYIQVYSNSELIGFAILSDSVLQYFYDLSWVCVDPAHRKQGIGSKIVQKAIDFSMTKDRSLVISTEQTRFYSELGFTICGEYRPGWYLMATTLGVNKI